MDKFQVSILEYLGKLDTGVLVLVSIVYNRNYYEGTYFYTNEQLVLTVQEELENDLDHKISEDENYTDLLRLIMKKIIPYNEIYNRLDPVNFSEMNKKVED